MAFHVDLNTRILGRNHGVYIARPGNNSRLLHDFAEIQAIGPDFPGFRVDTAYPIGQQPGLRNMLKRAMEIKKWDAAGQPEDSIPTMRLKFYSSKRNLKSRSEAQLISILEGYFERAQRGDLVVIPPNSYQHDAILAEFSDGPRIVQYKRLPSRYGKFELPTRSFKVLDKVSKRLLPPSVLDIIAKPNAFVQVGEENRNSLYHMAYGSFVFGNDFNSRFSVTARSYNFDNDFYFAAFIKFVSANTRAVTIERETRVRPIRVVAFEELGEYAPELRSNVNSPGYLSLTSQYITPLVAAALFSVALTVGPDAVADAQDELITFGNSEAPANDPCTAQVYQSVVDQLKLFELDQWAEACEIARRAARHSGLRPAPKIVLPKGRTK